MEHQSNDGFGGFGADDLSQTMPPDGFGGDPDTGRISRPATEPSDGFGAGVPATAPSDGFGDDAPSTEPNGAGFGDDNEGDKPGDETTPAPEHGLRAEGMDDAALAAIAEAFGENKVDASVGQAVLDKVLPMIAERRAEQWQAVKQEWITEKVAANDADPTIRPRVDLALSVLDVDTREALRSEVYADHPVLYRVLAEFGRFVQKATRPDTAVNGRSAAPAPRFAPNDTSSRAFAGGGGF